MNHWGTAPGLLFEKDDRIFAVMPGVPHEMQNLMTEYLVPRLKTKSTGQVINHRSLKTTGIAESSLYELIGNVEDILGGKAKLAFLPSQFGVRLRITVKAKKLQEADSIVAEVEQKNWQQGGEVYLFRGRYRSGRSCRQLLAERKLTLSIAESCTGGFISHRVTNVSGSSNYFSCGVVVYSNEAKTNLLRVDKELIDRFGAVSEEVARGMASGIRYLSGSDIGLSVTGIAGPPAALWRSL